MNSSSGYMSIANWQSVGQPVSCRHCVLHLLVTCIHKSGAWFNNFKRSLALNKHGAGAIICISHNYGTLHTSNFINIIFKAYALIFSYCLFNDAFHNVRYVVASTEKKTKD